MNIESHKVNFPPIIDAMIMLGFRSPLAPEKRASYAEAIAALFPNRSEVLDEIRIQHPEKGMLQGKSEVTTLLSKNNEREVTIGDVALIYRDGRTYESREKITASLEQIWTLCSLQEKAAEIDEIRFRVINKFNITPKYASSLRFLPKVKLKNTSTLLAGLNTEFHIRSDFRGADAIVKARLKPLTSDSLELLLDIDTYIENEEVTDFNSISAYLERLSEFKNDIFYGNIEDAVERFAHE